jgi:hypothetical protein
VPAATRHAVAAAAKQGSAGLRANGGGDFLAAAGALVPDQAFVPEETMYFRGGETGVRWISRVTGRDLLWQ